MLKLKKIMVLLLIIFNMLGCIVVYAAENENSNWKKEYFGVDDIATVVTDKQLKLYPDDNYNTHDSRELRRGDTIKIAKLITKEKTEKTPEYDILEVLINNQDTGYIYANLYMENTTRKSDSIFLNGYKTYFTSIQYYGAQISDRAGWFIIIACVLLLVFNGIIDAFLSRFIKVKESVSMFSMVLPIVITIIINIICNMVNHFKHYQILSEGFVLLPKNDTFMEWILYLSIYGAIILWMYSIFRIIKSYNPILTLIKIVESLIISYVLGFGIFLIGVWLIAIFAAISVFGIAISIRSAEVRRY